MNLLLPISTLLAYLNAAHANTSIPEKGIDQALNNAFMPVAVQWESLVFYAVSFGSYSIPLVLLLLLLGACLFTVYFGFINFRMLHWPLKIIKDYHRHAKKKDFIAPEGEVTPFQALTTALSGTVGLGNIAMVAVAISIGGPGATFWMVLAGLLGMTTKFVECTLSVKYRVKDKHGAILGGPMYYLKNGLKNKGLGHLGKILGIVFALLCVGASFGGGNAFQSNQAAAKIMEFSGVTSGSMGTVLGLIIAILVGIVIIGGIKRIAVVTEKIVPFMAFIYVGAAIFILLSHVELIDDAIKVILDGAFSPSATIAGGGIGVMLQGFRRAAFSNEAGAGSAAIAHAAVKTNYPASEGLVALLEPLIDTVVVCTMTALVIVIFNLEGAFTYGVVAQNKVTLLETGQQIGGVNLTSLAFNTLIPGFDTILSISVILFAFSTILSWSYYGLQAWKYLFGNKPSTALLFKIIYLLFTVLGAAVSLGAVIKFSDAMILAMVFPNMIGLFILFPQAKKELELLKNKFKPT